MEFCPSQRINLPPDCHVCSYRFMDMFPNTAMVREIQQELDKVIQQGVRSITRLIRATEPAMAETLQMRGSRRVLSGISAIPQLPSNKGQGGQKSIRDSKENSLSDRLVKDGLLTPDLLRQLQQEWAKVQNSENQRALDTDHHRTNKGRGRNKK